MKIGNTTYRSLNNKKTPNKAKNSKKIKFKLAQFFDPIYCREYEVFFGNVTEIKDWYTKTHNLLLVDEASDMDGVEPEAFVFYDNNRGIYVSVFNKRPLPHVIAHECSHLAKMALGHIGYTSKADDNEPEAYYQDFLVRMIYECKKKTAKLK